MRQFPGQLPGHGPCPVFAELTFRRQQADAAPGGAGNLAGQVEQLLRPGLRRFANDTARPRRVRRHILVACRRAWHDGQGLVDKYAFQFGEHKGSFGLDMPGASPWANLSLWRVEGTVRVSKPRTRSVRLAIRIRPTG